MLFRAAVQELQSTETNKNIELGVLPRRLGAEPRGLMQSSKSQQGAEMCL